MSSEITEQTQEPAAVHRALYRSKTNSVLGGVAGGLGESFDVDPVWFRIGFVILAMGGGSGVLIYILMWVIVPEQPDGYVSPQTQRGALPGAVVIGAVFVFVGTISLVNTLAPEMGRYFWPVVLVLGGVGLVIGGLNRDNR